MLTIVICVGSSCHVHGSDEVAETFERLIEKEQLSNRVELIGAFCMDACSMGVSVRVGDEVFRGVRPETAEAFFYDQVLPQAKQVLGG
jgi:NADH:ubiquinone oxidoreductase subunit E